MYKRQLKSFIKADTEIIESKHSGNYISNLNFDVSQITRMLSEAYLSIFKDGLTLIGLLCVMFFQNWKLSLIAIIMIPLASITAKVLGKRMSKISTQAQEKSGDLNRYLIDLFKNHKIIKIFQRENHEEIRSESFVNNLKEKSAKIAAVYIRSAPVMEILTCSRPGSRSCFRGFQPPTLDITFVSTVSYCLQICQHL